MLSRLRHRVDRLDELLDDWPLGIQTTEWHQQLDPSRPDFRGYSPTSYRDWRTIKRYLKPSGTFIDYGAGLGRVTILAAVLPYSRVIGVELNSDLVRRGNDNINRARPRLRCPTSLMCADATTFEVPDDVAVLYFANPFAGRVLRGVLTNINDSLRRTPRPMQIVCNLPKESAFEKEISTVDWLTLLKRSVLSSGQRKLLLFAPLP
jgi:hypothetical protein